LSDAPKSTIRETDDEARALARQLITTAQTAALGVIHPETGAPHVTRIAIATDPDGAPLTLISDLALHTRALRKQPRCSILLASDGEKGDPLTHPRITLSVDAQFHEGKELRESYLAQRPKATLFVDFADFHFVSFKIETADLNAGFGKAYQLSCTDFQQN